MTEPLAETVDCRACGVTAKSLARHLKAIHGLTADEYRAQYGQDALIRSPASEARRRAGIKRAHREKPKKGLTKMDSCVACEKEIEVSAFGPALPMCEGCADAVTESYLAELFEPEDYITCLECGHRAENLTAHITNAHPGYRERHPEALVVALNSAVRDKTALKGRTLSDETRKKMSINAGRWNKGLTKETDARVARAAEKMRGRVPWSKGLKASKDERLAKAVAKLRLYVGENRPWHNGLRAELVLEDFKPFLDAEGRIDRQAITEAVGLSWRTIFTYMGTFHLETSDKYIQERASGQVIRLDKETLEASKLGNGKVSIARARKATGHSFSVIKRECERHGLETFSRKGQQTLCLDAVSEALGGLPYKMEWESWDYTNPVSGYRFRFDGYFKDIGLVVEYHGHQHFMFPNAFMTDESYEPLWLAMLERDRVKQELIEAAPDLTYFMVRYDEPYEDSSYLQGRLHGLGVRAG